MRISDWSSDVCSSDLDEFGRGRAVEVGTAKARSALEGAILVEDDALGDERHPGKIVGEGSGFGAIFGEVHHGRIQTGNLRWRRATSTNCGSCRAAQRSEEHTSELQSLMRISYAVFCLKKKKKNQN